MAEAFIGLTVSVIDKKTALRYVGIVAGIDQRTATITLISVRCCGTESRPAPVVLPPSASFIASFSIAGPDIADLVVQPTPALVVPASAPAAHGAPPLHQPLPPSYAEVSSAPAAASVVAVAPPAASRSPLASASSQPGLPPSVRSTVVVPPGAANNPTNAPRVFGLPRDYSAATATELVPGVGGFVAKSRGKPRAIDARCNEQTFGQTTEPHAMEDSFDFSSANSKFDKASEWAQIAREHVEEDDAPAAQAATAAATMAASASPTSAGAVDTTEFDAARIRAEHASVIAAARKLDSRVVRLCEYADRLDHDECAQLEELLQHALSTLRIQRTSARGKRGGKRR